MTTNHTTHFCCACSRARLQCGEKRARLLRDRDLDSAGVPATASKTGLAVLRLELHLPSAAQQPYHAHVWATQSCLGLFCGKCSCSHAQCSGPYPCLLHDIPDALQAQSKARHIASVCDTSRLRAARSPERL